MGSSTIESQNSQLTVQENVHGLGLFTEVLDNDARASNNLAGVTLTVDLAETGPFTELLSIGDLDQVDVVLSAKSLNELDVLLLSAGLNEDSKVSLTSRRGVSLHELADPNVHVMSIFTCREP